MNLPLSGGLERERPCWAAEPWIGAQSMSIQEKAEAVTGRQEGNPAQFPAGWRRTLMGKAPNDWLFQAFDRKWTEIWLNWRKK